MSETWMFVAYGEADGRHLRLFTRESAAEQDWDALARDDVDDADRERAAELARVLRAGTVTGTAHPGTDPDDVIHVYLDAPPGPRLFACVVVSEVRAERMLDEAPWVLEGFSLQVAAGRNVTPDALRAALDAWAARNFPAARLPRFTIAPWLAAPEAGLLHVDLHIDMGSPAHVDAKLPSRFVPSAAIARPPYREAA